MSKPLTSPKLATLSAMLLALSACSQQAVVPSANQGAQPIGHRVSEVMGPPKPVLFDHPSSELATDSEQIWQRIRRGFALDPSDHARLEPHLRWYRKRDDHIERVGKRAAPYLYLVTERIEARGMPTELALLPFIESAYRPYAYSHGRASGLWQFVPATGRRFGMKQNWWYDGRRDVVASTEGALAYLGYLNKMFDGDWLLTLAAYNAGEGNVLKAIRRNRAEGKPTDYWSLDLPQETKHYVPRFLALVQMVTDPEREGVVLPDVPNTPYLAEVDTGGQIDLDIAAELAGIDRESLYQYNPGYNRWATDPDGPYRLLIPVEKAEAFQSALAERGPQQRITWRSHTIRQGETLGEIAERYGLRSADLRRANRLSNNLIRAGKELIIPQPRQAEEAYAMSESQRRKQVQEKAHGDTRVTYHVRAGDTLSTIAAQHGVGTRELARWNAMAPGDTLSIGTELVTWQTSTKAAGLAHSPLDRPALSARQQKIAYEVRKGDSLALISQRFRVSIEQLRDWNRLHGQRYLRPGQQLTLYIDVTRQSGSI